MNVVDDYYQDSSIRKGILLSRYASLVKNWIYDERKNHNVIDFDARVDEDVGIILPPDYPILGQWERQSIPLKVSYEYEILFNSFERYFEDEMDEIGDNDLEQELDILHKLGRYNVRDLD